MNHLRLKLLFIASITLALGALMLRLGWEVTRAEAMGTMVIVALMMLATLGIYAISLYLVINPKLSKLESPLIQGGFFVIVTAGFIAGIIHYYRFMPSPEASATISKVLATMLLSASFTGYALVVDFMWHNRKKKR